MRPQVWTKLGKVMIPNKDTQDELRNWSRADPPLLLRPLVYRLAVTWD